MELNKVYNGDCLELMRDIPDGSIDMVCCDLPYEMLNRGNPDARWDKMIPFEPLWKQYERIVKSNGAIVLFSQGMFTAKTYVEQRETLALQSRLGQVEGNGVSEREKDAPETDRDYLRLLPQTPDL